MKSIRRMVLGVCLLFGMVCGNAVIVQADAYGDYEYSVDDEGNATITRYNGNESDVVVPSQIDGHTVTKLKQYLFAREESLKSVSIPEGVTAIDKYVFLGSANLEKVILPSKLLSIGEKAFYGCSKLQNIDIPESVTDIGANAFEECSSLTEVYIPKNVSNIKAPLFVSCTNLASVQVSSDNAVYYSQDNCIITKAYGVLVCAGNTNVVPQGVTAIGDYAFYGSEVPAYMELPTGLKRIGWGAFMGSTVKDIRLPDTTESIEWGAFSCALSSIDIPPSVTKIDDAVFEGIIVVPMSLNAELAAEDKKTEKYQTVIVYREPGSYADKWVERYNANANRSEYQYPFRKAYTLPDVNCRVKVLSEGDDPTVEYRNPISEDATEYTIPATITANDVTYRVTSVADNAFAECGNVKKVTLGQNVKQIQPDAFAGAAEEEGDLELVIPEELEDISNIGIMNISNVNNLTVNVAAGSKAEIYLQQNTTIHYQTYLPAQNPEPDKKDDTETEKQNPDNSGEDASKNQAGVNEPVIGRSYPVGNGKYKMLSTDKVAFVGAVNKKKKTLKIPDVVTIAGRLHRVVRIEKRAMKGCATLQTVMIGNQVTEIGEEAFYKCKKLQKVTIGSRVVKIGKGAFRSDKKLKRLIFKGSKVKKIGKKALKGVPRKVKITAPKKSVPKYKKLLNAAK